MRRDTVQSLRRRLAESGVSKHAFGAQIGLPVSLVSDVCNARHEHVGLEREELTRVVLGLGPLPHDGRLTIKVPPGDLSEALNAERRALGLTWPAYVEWLYRGRPAG
jgi:hypothetical protein